MLYKYILLIILFLPVHVFAMVHSIELSIQEDNFSDYIFDVVDGSKHNVSFVVKNTSDSTQNIIVHIVGDESKSLVSRTKFFVVDALADDYQELLQHNKNDIVLFCDKNWDKSEINEWCDGSAEIAVSLQSGETVIVPAVIDIMNGETDHIAEIVASKEGGAEVLRSAQIIYHVPDKNIVRLTLQGFSLQRASGFFDIKEWMRDGFQNKYIAKISVQNVGTEKIDYAYCASVQSLWIDESVNFCNDGIISYNDKQEKDFQITVPRFGKVYVIGSVQYIDEDGVMQEQASNSIEFIVWPVQLIVILLIFICFCSVCVLLYKYIKKNMFGFKKKKEDKKFTGSYVVKGTDNIISIAQSYGVPWKELASINDIEPPYILISGETISVPGEDEDKEAVASEGAVAQKQPNGVQNKQNGAQQKDGNLTAVQSSKMQNNMGAMTQDKKMQATSIPQELQNSQKSATTQGNSKRKVTYASPKNMVTKPASEPTTRAIDIEWMKDDEAVYSEDMQTQKKKMNMRFIVMTVLGLVIVGGVVWWGTMWFLNSNNQEDVSIDALIVEEKQDENIAIESDASEGTVAMNDSSQEPVDDVGDATEENQDGNDSGVEGDVKDISSENITVQVLNAGAAVGAAGTVTDEFTQKGYKTTTAQNAQNDYNGVVIYYSADAKENLDAISAAVPEKYGTQKYEESDETTNKYSADFVVVLGS